MSISHPPHHLTPAPAPAPVPTSDNPSCSLPSKPSRSLHNRRQSKKRRLDTTCETPSKGDKPYTPFFVPQDILDRNEAAHHPHHSSQPQSASLTTLPAELLLLIVEHLSIPYFQVCLTLTCKRVATLLSQNRTRMSPWRGYQDKEGLYRLLTQQERPLSRDTQSLSCRTKQRNLSLDHLSIGHDRSSTPVTTSQPYIPTSYRLCRACFRHVPRDPIYWQSRMRTPEYDAPTVNWFDITNFFDEGYRNCGQHKCPDCCVNGYVAIMNQWVYVKAAREDTRDEEWGVEMDGEGRGRRVSPGLVERLGRP